MPRRPALSTPFVDEDFHFKGTILTGAKEILPRWKRCVSSTDRALGEALGAGVCEEGLSPGGQNPRPGHGEEPGSRAGR